MKTILPIIFLFFTSSAFGQTNADSIIKENRVKEVRISDIKNNIVSVSKYDTLGRLIFSSMDNFTSATSLKTSVTKIYDEYGNNIKTISTHSSFTEPLIWTHEYDLNRNRVAVKNIKGNFVFQFLYDDLNFLVREFSFDDSNKITQTTTFRKVDSGRKIISVITGNFIRNRTNTTYLDNNGNAIKVESWDGDKINFSTHSTYQNNRLTKVVYNDEYGSAYYYDSAGRLIKRQNFKIDNNKEIKGGFEEFKYNRNGLLTHYRENIHLNGKLRDYQYKYDYYD